MDFKTLFDAAGNLVKMAGRQTDAAAIFRPVHHSEIVTIRTSLARPNDVIPYIAGDMVCALFTFDIGALGVPAALIVGSRLARDVTTDQGVRFRGMVHNAVPPVMPVGDNAPSPLMFANSASRRGWIDYAAPIAGEAAGGDCLEYPGQLSNVQGITVDPADGIVRVVLSTRDAFTPLALKNFAIELDLVV